MFSLPHPAMLFGRRKVRANRGRQEGLAVPAPSPAHLFALGRPTFLIIAGMPPPQEPKPVVDVLADPVRPRIIAASGGKYNQFRLVEKP